MAANSHSKLQAFGFAMHSSMHAGASRTAEPSPRPNRNIWERLTARMVRSWGASPYATVLLSHLLFALFVAYYVVLLAIAVSLFETLREMQIDSWLKGIAAVVLAVVVIRLAVELMMGMIGLVTDKYDGPNPSMFGPLLNDSNSPKLQHLITQVGERTRGPLPNEVRVGPYAECYVYENRQFGLSTKRRLVLVIGLPHLAVLTATELKIILAHELAHFAGGDTRLGVFLHRFLEFLRDRTDRASRGRWWRVDPVFWFRWLYFVGSQLLASPIWRSQELRADATSARAFGGRLAARTLLREWLLAEQFREEVDQWLFASKHGMSHTANVYDSFADQFRRFTPAGEQYLRRRLADEESTDLSESHPSIRARIDMVLSFPDRDPPDTSPARRLIGDFDVIKDLMQSELANRGQRTAFSSPAAGTD